MIETFGCGDDMRHVVLHFVRTQNGATAVEYALLGGLVIVVIVTAIANLGSSVVSLLYDKILGAF